MFKMSCVLACALCGGRVGTQRPHSAHASTQVRTHNSICSYYNHYKHTHLTRNLIYLYFYIVLQDILNIYLSTFLPPKFVV